MGCSKTLTLSTITCELETCSTKARVDLGTQQLGVTPIAFAPDLCYCCVVAMKSDYSESYFYKYDPTSNTLTLKATYVGDLEFNLVYDAKHQKFVTAGVGTDKIVIFDPITETVSSFSSGIMGCNPMVYIPEKEKTYGHFGVDGGGNHYFGYVDLDLLTVVQLVAIPGGVNPSNYVYAPLNDMVYGSAGTVGGPGLLPLIKVDLVGPTATLINATGVGSQIALWVAWDSDAALLIALCGSAVTEVNVLTNTRPNTTSVPGTDSFEKGGIYVSSLKKLFAIGRDVSADGVIVSYNTQTLGIATVLSDYGYGTTGGLFNSPTLCQFKDGSFIAPASDKITFNCGVRRLCLT